ITNAGHAPVWTRIDSSGVPTAAQPPVTAGLQIERRYYDRDGNPVDQASILRNDRLVVVIRGEARTGVAHQALVVDLLPAGLEIENSRLGHNSSTADLDWLPELSDTRHIESLADRYEAALDLPPEERRFTLAYQVRAVTPGDYALPAVFVEDMYQPWFHGRGASARLAVR
ncbi:MAG: hypothetical protein R3202_11505, partial [Candidatus Competibacterales bacterium]|nr:hypothetical protein [Candidatus Competibacterales bacterium]